MPGNEPSRERESTGMPGNEASRVCESTGMPGNHVFRVCDLFHTSEHNSPDQSRNGVSSH